MTKCAPLIALLVLAAACGSSSSQIGNRTLADQAKYERAVEAKTLLIGMTKSEVKQVIGSPDDKDTEIYGGNRLERWSYPKRSLDVYFDEEGFLVRWRAPFG
jgi:outer membrane protein assembly factor BamE (lipoprotein component of BamABCDE complex)